MAIPVAVAYGIYTLGGVIVKAGTKALAQRLINGGFRKASSGVASSAANIINATSKNIPTLITRGIKGARTSTKGPITQGVKVKPKPKTQAEVKEALKRNENKVSSKKFGDKKLSDLGRVGPKPATTKLSPGSSSRTVITKKPKPSAAKPIPKPKSKTGAVLSTAIGIGLTPSKTADGTVKTRAKDRKDFEKKEVKKANQDSKIVGEQIANKADSVTKIVNSVIEKKTAPPANVVRLVVQEVSKKDKYKTETTPAEKEALRKMEAAAVKKQLSTFGKAFKSARAAKKYSFKYKGKEITTRYKEESVAEHKKKFPKKK